MKEGSSHFHDGLETPHLSSRLRLERMSRQRIRSISKETEERSEEGTVSTRMSWDLMVRSTSFSPITLMRFIIETTFTFRETVKRNDSLMARDCRTLTLLRTVESLQSRLFRRRR